MSRSPQSHSAACALALASLRCAASAPLAAAACTPQPETCGNTWVSSHVTTSHTQCVHAFTPGALDRSAVVWYTSSKVQHTTGKRRTRPGDSGLDHHVDHHVACARPCAARMLCLHTRRGIASCRTRRLEKWNLQKSREFGGPGHTALHSFLVTGTQQHNTLCYTLCNTGLHVFSNNTWVTHVQGCVIECVLHTCIMCNVKSSRISRD